MKETSNFRVLTLIIMLFGAANAFGTDKKSDCLHKTNTICKSINKLNPKMDLKEAYKLSNLFAKMARKYKLPPKLLVSIAFQESSFKHDAIRKVSGFVFDTDSNEYKKVKVGSDFCMMQIHISNINKMELSVEKLLNSPKYCIEAGAKVLSRYKGLYSKTQKNWWTHYNAKSKAKQNIYFNKVSRHLKKISGPRSVSRVVASSK
jgi:hypothetical protein